MRMKVREAIAGASGGLPIESCPRIALFLQRLVPETKTQ
jgi:hypothetical protein